MWPALLTAVALTLWGIPAPAEELSGPVRVIDGDTLAMDGARIRLWGIDAPEMQQTCAGKDGRTYECGRDSAAVMRELTRGRILACDGKGHDRYGRIVAVCRTEAGDVSAAIVRRGWAVDWPRYSHARYHSEEQSARDEQLGIWSGRFELPWLWRAEHPH
jgi:endonuclease YncB( thermonuclease family)